MPKVTFINADGSRTVVDAPVGATLLELAHKHNIDIEGACEGSLACSTCHVIVAAEWFGKLKPPSEDEQDPLLAAPGPGSDNPLEQVAAGDAMQALEQALLGLPARQREAFVLRNFEGLDVLQTAAAMGCTEGSVKTHYSRAVHRLRELMKEHGGEHSDE